MNPIQSDLSKQTHKPQLDRVDLLVALALAVLALGAYVRTLAPDLLYGDSAEFQCLAYTFGVTHSTGYPTYLLLARLVGFLPIHSPAYRINLFSALCAAVTVGGVYFLGRYFTRSRTGPALAALALGFSYTFWSQAIIAEVYTPGMAFLVAVSLLLFRWQADPIARSRALFAAALLAGIGFGVHASVWLIALPAAGFVLYRLRTLPATRSEWRRSLLAPAAGALLGILVTLAAFWVSDELNSPTSFIRTTLIPSRVFWDLEAQDFDSTFQRLKMTVVSAQWGNALFPGGDFSFWHELITFLERLVHLEFSSPLLVLVLLGFAIMLVTFPAGAGYTLVWLLFSAFIILNYRVGDKYVFYLSLYLPMMVAAGAGMGYLLEKAGEALASLPARGHRLLSLLPVLFFATLVLQPAAAIRWEALKAGQASFVTETYAYPLGELDAPRAQATWRLAGVEDGEVFVMDWRALYTTAYLAHVEKGLTQTLFFEAMPYGNRGQVASSLVSILQDHLQSGRRVYVEQRYPGLEQYFRITPGSADWYVLSLPR